MNILKLLFTKCLIAESGRFHSGKFCKKILNLITIMAFISFWFDSEQTFLKKTFNLFSIWPLGLVNLTR